MTKVRKKYGLTGKRIILTNSAHSPRKNTGFLVRVFGENKIFSDDFCLVVCGRGSGRNEIEENSSVIWPGHVDQREMRALYQMADLFVYPSLYEGFGLPVLEAMASKCLFLASDISCLREVVENKGLLFNPKEGKELA